MRAPVSWKSCWLVLFLGFAGASSAYAGFYISPEVKWGLFSASPKESEPTPNYYGYGGGVHLGFSAKQIFDMGVYASYLPGRLGSATMGLGDASFLHYGGELALRIKESVYFGLHGGMAMYDLREQKRTEEIPGTWTGPAGGITVGAIHALSKQSFLQTSIDFTHAVMQSQDTASDDAETGGKRSFDSFSVSIAYVFNDYKTYLIENTIFKGFLDSVIFF